MECLCVATHLAVKCLPALVEAHSSCSENDYITKRMAGTRCIVNNFINGCAPLETSVMVSPGDTIWGTSS